MQYLFSLPCGHGLHFAQLYFSLPCGHGLHFAHMRFSLPCGQPLQSAQSLFRLPCGHGLHVAQLSNRVRFSHVHILFPDGGLDPDGVSSRWSSSPRDLFPARVGEAPSDAELPRCDSASSSSSTMGAFAVPTGAFPFLSLTSDTFPFCDSFLGHVVVSPLPAQVPAVRFSLCV